MGEQVRVVIREYLPEQDRAFIYSSWRNSAFYLASVKTEQERFQKDPKAFFREQTALIRDVLDKAIVKIACVQDAREIILGYAVARGSHLDWVYVKLEFRGRGIGQALTNNLPEIQTVTPHLTTIGAIIVEKKKLKIKENDHAGNSKGTKEENGTSQENGSGNSGKDPSSD